MEGLNPIIEAPAHQDDLSTTIRNAVSTVASAMREGMLTAEDIDLLENSGIRKLGAKQSAYDTVNDLLGMAQAIQDKVSIMMAGESLIDAAELARLVGTVVKLMDHVRKFMSEAKRIEELAALEAALHECLSDIQEEVEGTPEAKEAVERATKTMLRNLEDRLKIIETKFE